MKLSEILPRGLVPRGGSATLHTLPVGGKIFLGQSTDTKPPSVFWRKLSNRSIDSSPHCSRIMAEVQSSQVLWPQHSESMRSSMLVRLEAKSSAAIKFELQLLLYIEVESTLPWMQGDDSRNTIERWWRHVTSFMEGSTVLYTYFPEPVLPRRTFWLSWWSIQCWDHRFLVAVVCHTSSGSLSRTLECHSRCYREAAKL